MVLATNREPQIMKFCITKHVNGKTACHATRRRTALCSFVVTRYDRRQDAGPAGTETVIDCCLSLLGPTIHSQTWRWRDDVPGRFKVQSQIS
jgi:hypothetical protein